MFIGIVKFWLTRIDLVYYVTNVVIICYTYKCGNVPLYYIRMAVTTDIPYKHTKI